MKKYLLPALFFVRILAYGQTGTFSVYLVGDAGEDTVAGKALLLLQKEIEKDPNSAVVFLGDNVYPSGFSKGDHRSEQHLRSQLDVLKKYAGQVYMVPGNHDWDAQRKNGWKKILEEKEFVDAYMKEQGRAANKNGEFFYPAAGLPGPATVMLNVHLRLIMIDTQWFLQQHKKNMKGSRKQTINKFYETLDSLLAYAHSKGEQVLIAAHHPMYTNGAHGKRMQPLRFFVNYTPFKVFGWMGLDRLFSQDLSQPGYKKMRKRLLASLEQYDNVVYASGHDHNVQYFREKNLKFIVSGNGSKLSKLRRRERFSSIFKDDSKTGFVKLEYEEGKVRTIIYRVGETEINIEDR